MRESQKWTSTKTLLMASLLGLACHDGARTSLPEELDQEEALDAFEADLLSKGATPVVAKMMREASRLKNGQVLIVGPADSFKGDSAVLRRIPLPDGQEAVVVWENGR